jgi:hypothetical protein
VTDAPSGDREESADCPVQAPVGGHDPVVPPDAEPPYKPLGQPTCVPFGAVRAGTSAPDFPGGRAQCDSGTAVPAPNSTPFAATATATSFHGTAGNEPQRLFPQPDAFTSRFWEAPTPASASCASTDGVPTSIGKAELGYDLESGPLVSALETSFGSASQLGDDPTPPADRVSAVISTVSDEDTVRCTMVRTVGPTFPKARGRVRKRKVPPSQVSRPPDKRHTPWFKQESCRVVFTGLRNLQFDLTRALRRAAVSFLGCYWLCSASTLHPQRNGFEPGRDFTRPWLVTRTAIGRGAKTNWSVVHYVAQGASLERITLRSALRCDVDYVAHELRCTMNYVAQNRAFPGVQK